MTTTHLYIDWKSGTLNDTAIKVLREKNINWHYDHCFNLVADFYGIGLFQKVEYDRLHDDIYAIYGGDIER